VELRGSCVVRPARPEDVEAVVTLCGEHAAYEKSPWVSEGKLEGLAAALFKDPPKLWCLVAEVDSDIVGYASYTREFSTWWACDFVYLDCLYVREAYRGTGIGRQMMEIVCYEARVLGCSVVKWHTPVWNSRAARFYERLGATGEEKLRFIWQVR
jgi:GNAT superfamily N-acetyltransferase